MTLPLRNAISVLSIAAIAGLAIAEPGFQLTWYTTASCGAIDASNSTGRFGLDVSIGQIDGRAPGYNAPYNLQPGFWGGDPPCVADRTGDYIVDLSDFFAFFNCWDLTEPCADLDGSGEVDLLDFFAFFSAWDVSC